MTTIAYSNGVMACDSCWSGDGAVFTKQIKIFRTQYDVIVGTAGDMSDWDLVKVWHELRSPDDFPTLRVLKELTQPASDIEHLISFPTGELFNFSCGPINEAPVMLYPVLAPHVAIGSGRAHAVAALEMGATPEQAVEIACRFDIFSKPPVHVMRHNLKNKSKKRASAKR